VVSEIKTSVALRVTVDRSDFDVAGRDDGATAMLCHLVASGTRDAAADATGRALCGYWGWLGAADRDRRHDLAIRLRQVVEQGRTGLRAWVPVILGDTDFELVRAATHAYVDARPVSLEQLERRVADALDWIRRGLALNRAAVFVALLEGADETLLPRLTGLRGLMSAAEARVVWQACACLNEDATRAFLDEWRASHEGDAVSLGRPR
jgi:hypothetical protein